MGKYVIRNCECEYRSDNFCWTKDTFCQDCTDCLLKRIVQVCNEWSDKWEDCDFSNGLANEIFKLLDLQEVE